MDREPEMPYQGAVENSGVYLVERVPLGAPSDDRFFVGQWRVRRIVGTEHACPRPCCANAPKPESDVGVVDALVGDEQTAWLIAWGLTMVARD